MASVTDRQPPELILRGDGLDAIVDTTGGFTPASDQSRIDRYRDAVLISGSKGIESREVRGAEIKAQIRARGSRTFAENLSRYRAELGATWTRADVLPLRRSHLL